MRAVRWAGAVVVAALGVYCCLVALGLAGVITIGTVAIATFTVAIVGGSALVCGLRAHFAPQDRAAWWCFCAALTSYTLGTLLWHLIYQFRDPQPYPSVSDGLWLLLDPLCIIGIWLMVRARLGLRASALLDGAVSALGVASVASLYVLPGITDDPRASLASVVTNFAYPLVDLALASTAVGATAALRAWRRRTWVLLTTGFVVFTVADTWYLVLVVADTFQIGQWNDVCYLVAIVLVALAALHPDDPENQPDPNRRREFLVPVLFGLLPLWVLVASSLRAGRPPLLAVILAVAALATLALRTALAIREVVALSDQRRLARTDSLTGLPNRRAFYDRLGEAPDGAVLIIDLDRFKEINDALGHQIGDELLRQVAARFADRVRSNSGPGVIARLGGDEFAVHLPFMPKDAAARVASDLLIALEEPFTVAGTLLHVGGSIGITNLTPGVTVGTALAEADMAMYRAKTARTGFEVYDTADASSAWVRLAMVEALRLALDRDELTLAFQPIVDAHTRRPRSVEALVRWSDAERGPVPPDVFLPLAEHAGLMPQLTRQVLDRAFEEARQLRDLGHRIAISVNLSASDLLDGRLQQELARRLADSGLPSSAIKIEITESLLVDSGGRAGEFLLAMRELGIELLVDDFGTGYSSMAYLHDLPVSTLKIDRAFTGRLGHDVRTGIIVASTIDMAHRLGLDVVAEGVETEDQLDWLRAEGCDLIQGYLMSRPLPAADLHAWLDRGVATSGSWERTASAGRPPSSAADRRGAAQHQPR